VLVRHNRSDHGDTDHRQRRRPPDCPIGRVHPAPSLISENSAELSHGLVQSPRTAATRAICQSGPEFGEIAQASG